MRVLPYSWPPSPYTHRYRNLGILFNEQTLRVKTAVRNFDRAAALMREIGEHVPEEKIVKHALLQVMREETEEETEEETAEFI